MRVRKGGIFPSWLALPPIVSLPLFVLIIIMGDPDNAHFLGFPLSLGAFFCYAALTGAYIISMQRTSGYSTLSFGLLAQGLLLLVVGSAVGAPTLLLFIGAGILAVGAILGIAALMHTPQPDAPAENKIITIVKDSGKIEWEKIMPCMPLPALFAEAGGNVSAPNEQMTSLVGDGIFEAPLQKYFAPDEHEIKIMDMQWNIFSKKSDAGTVLILTPNVTSSDEGEGKKSSEAKASEAIGEFYPSQYSPKRCKEELDRAKRYRRPMSAALLHIDIGAANAGLVPDDDVLKTFEQLLDAVQQHTRACDIKFKLPNNEILILLPESPSNACKLVYDRIKGLFEQEISKWDDLSFAPLLRGGLVSYSGDEDWDYHALMRELTTALNRSKSA